MTTLERSRSVRALASVGSLLGLSSQEETDKWHNCVEDRAKQGQIGFVLMPKKSQLVPSARDETEEEEYAMQMGSSLAQIIDLCDVDRMRLRDFSSGIFDSHDVSGADDMEEFGIEPFGSTDTAQELARFPVSFDPGTMNPGYVDQSAMKLVDSEASIPPAEDHATPSRFCSESTFPAKRIRQQLSVQFSEQVISVMPEIDESDIEGDTEIDVENDNENVDSDKDFESDEESDTENDDSDEDFESDVENDTEKIDESDNDMERKESEKTVPVDNNQESRIRFGKGPTPHTSTPVKSVPPSPDIKPPRGMLKNKNEKSLIHEATLPSTLVTDEDLIYRTEALEQYRDFVQFEKSLRLNDLRHKCDSIRASLEQKRQKIDELLDVAKDHYCGKHGVKDSKWRTLIRSFRKKDPAQPQTCGTSEMYVRRQLEALPQYFPWFTYILCLAQVISFCVICGLGGVTTVGLEPVLQLEAGVITLLGLETKEHWHIPNIWIGPSRAKMIGFGAVYAPCMRDDQHIQQMYSVAYNDTDGTLGCCEAPSGGAAATMYQHECITALGSGSNYQVGVLCSRRAGLLFTPHNLWPCCYGFQGQCQMTTHEHCQFLEGIYHGGQIEHCTLVNCLSSLCGLGGLTSDVSRPYSPVAPDQGYRLLVAVLYHHGFIHLLLVVTVTFLVARPIEMVAGWIRMLCLFLIPAYMALLVGAIMDPYSPHVGGSGGLFGLIAVVIVELIQSWHLVPRPWLEVAKLCSAFVLFFLAGTLPCVDNYSLITGFVLGLLCGIIFLPYITFGRRSMIARRVLIAVALPVLLMLVIILFYLFYSVQIVTKGCDWCKSLNCLPYTDSMCKVLELW